MKIRCILNCTRILLGFIICILIFPPLSPAAVVEGIVLSENGPLPDAQVYAYKKYSDIKNGNPSYISVKGEKPGFYKMELPPGRYYFTASGQSKGQKYFTYHGANPIEIKQKDLWVPFMTLQETEEVVHASPASYLSGKVTFRSEAVRHAQVSIYPVPDSELRTRNSSFRGMGYLTSTTDTQGLFRMNAEPGEYVIVARKRQGFRGVRPLRKGDLFCYFSGNPVHVQSLKETMIEIPCYPKDDLKAFLDEDVYPSILVKKSTDKSVRFRESRLEHPGNVFKISGRVTGLDGSTEKGLYVMAYKGKPSHMFKMLYVRTMPDYLVKTGENGIYTITAEEEGTYYLVARELIGEAPARGEYYGLYEENANHSVTLDRESLDNVDIVVGRVMAEKTGTQNTEDRTQTTKYKKVAAEIGNVEYSGDVVIHEDTIWNGYIVIQGTIHIARGATLKIKPGTTVLFRKSDNNNDGVGDGKITVSGRMIAEGAPDAMIRFTSAEEEPEMMDWSYLLFFVSGDDNIVKHCIFEYAFTGVQVHFSKAAVTDSIFRENQEGLRFGRTELKIAHNDISHNSYGIRYTRLEGPVEITRNNIRHNNVGIFHVPSNQNIVDFSETFSREKTFHQHQPVVRYNNISYNGEYNFRLGERQGYNMQLKDNWWGGREDSAIAEMIYDERSDASLGKVEYKPYLMNPVKSAGVRRGG